MAANWDINTICIDASGNLYAGGGFTNSSGSRYVAKWDGTTWSELGGPNALAASGDILSICTDASGNIYTAGGFLNSSGNIYTGGILFLG